MYILSHLGTLMLVINTTDVSHKHHYVSNAVLFTLASTLPDSADNVKVWTWILIM